MFMSFNKTEEIKANILIIDPSSFARRNLSMMLEGLGHNVVGEASDVKQTFENLSKGKVNVCLINIFMDKTDGIELASSIIDNFRNVYLIMMTNTVDDYIVLESIMVGAYDCLVKPIRPDILNSSVHKVLEHIKRENK